MRFSYAVTKRRRRGRIGVLKLEGAAKHLHTAYVKIDTSAGYVFGLPKSFSWTSEADREAAVILGRLRTQVEHEEAYARSKKD